MNLTQAQAGVRDGKPRKKRLGRGFGSGIGKTCGRGIKGQWSRRGPGVHFYGEGGQMPLWRRTTKRGFTNGRFRTALAVVNVGDLAGFAAGATVDEASLRAAGVLRGPADGFVLLGDGDCAVKGLEVRGADRVSAGARAKIEAAGGKITLREYPKPRLSTRAKKRVGKPPSAKPAAAPAPKGEAPPKGEAAAAEPKAAKPAGEAKGGKREGEGKGGKPPGEPKPGKPAGEPKGGKPGQGTPAAG